MAADTVELVAALERKASRVRMPAGTVLFRSGERVSGVFLVYSGAVRLSLTGSDGIFPSWILGPGEIAGLPATLTGTYSLSGEVIEEAEIGFVPGRRVTEILECSQRLCFVAMLIISEEIARMRATIRNNASAPLDE